MRRAGFLVCACSPPGYWQFLALFESPPNKTLPAFERPPRGLLARIRALAADLSALFCQRSVVKHLVGKGKKPSSR
jgi:hypothetical protein